MLIGRLALSSFTQASISGCSATTQFSVVGGFNRLSNVFSSDGSDQVRSARLTLNYCSPDSKLALQFFGLYTSDCNRFITIDLTTYTDLPLNLRLYDSTGNLAWSDRRVNYDSLNLTNPLDSLYQPYLSVSDNLSANLNLAYQVLPGLTLRTSTGYNTFITSESVRRLKASVAPTFSTLASPDFGGSASKSYILKPKAEYRRTFGNSNLSVLTGMTFQS